jgi:hypothetical protein
MHTCTCAPTILSRFQDAFSKTETSPLRRTGSDIVERKTHIPGYTGFIRNGEVGDTWKGPLPRFCALERAPNSPSPTHANRARLLSHPTSGCSLLK